MYSKRLKLLVALVLLISFSLLYATYSGGGLLPQSAPMWAFGTQDKYYVVSSKWVKEDASRSKLLESAGDMQLSESELRAAIAKELVKSDSPLAKNVEEEVKKTYSAEFKETFRKQVEAESREMLTQSRYYHMLMSYQVLEEARADFLENNKKQVESGILKKLAGSQNENLLKQLAEGKPLLVERGKYFAHILRHIKMEFEPVGLGVKSKGKNMLNMGSAEVPNPLHSLRTLFKGRVKLTNEDHKDLKLKHEQVANYLRGLAVPPLEIYHGTSIVISASRHHFLGAVNVLVQLRELGSELPVEIVVNTSDDIDKSVCGDFVAKHNAKCLVLEDELGKEVYKTLNLDGFPLKSLGLLLSSFDNTLHLDADTFPIKNVDFLFESEPFLQTKFVLWPDNWHRTISPLYYDIAGYKLGEVVQRSGIPNNQPFAEYASRNRTKVQLHDLAGAPSHRSVESGQLLLSKREHFRSLFLSFYYNLNGPLYYYPLLYQGSFGSGDRETFVAALHVMNEPYYLTDVPLSFSGVTRKRPHKPEETFFDESTMIQHDPSQSWTFIGRWKQWLESKELDTRLLPFQDNEYTTNLRKDFFEENSDVQQPEALFLHVHDPKINSLFNEVTEKSRYDYKSRYIQDVGEAEPVFRNTDWELKFQAINTWVTCEVFEKSYWEKFSLEQADICKKSEEYLAILSGNSNDKKAGELKIKPTK